MNADLEHARELLNFGEVVGMPTETVYGLAARIDLPRAIEKIFLKKQRPFFDPLIVHVASIDQARKLSSAWPKTAELLAYKFWPGPLTLVVPKANSVNPQITSGLESVGIRMPRHPLALELIQACGPLAAPSANKFGKTSPTTSQHVKSEFETDDVFVLEGGNCEVGIESTVVLIKSDGKIDSLSILRHGHVLQSDMETFLKATGVAFQFVQVTDKKESPGHMKHHYMPAIPLIIVSEKISNSITMGSIIEIANRRLPELPAVVENVEIIKPQETLRDPAILELGDNPEIAARILYSSLRDSAEGVHDFIVFLKKDFHSEIAWTAIMDRLNKAASLTLDETP